MCLSRRQRHLTVFDLLVGKPNLKFPIGFRFHEPPEFTSIHCEVFNIWFRNKRHLTWPYQTLIRRTNSLMTNN